MTMPAAYQFATHSATLQHQTGSIRLASGPGSSIDCRLRSHCNFALRIAPVVHILGPTTEWMHPLTYQPGSDPLIGLAGSPTGPRLLLGWRRHFRRSIGPARH